MTQNRIIGVIAVIIIVAIGIWYYMSLGTTSDSASATASSTNTGSTAASGGADTKTFKSIFTQSGNHECTYEQVAASSKSSSVVYIADGKMRGEFRTTTGNTTSANLMVYDGGYLYSWKEGASVGKKTSIKSVADLPEVIPTDLTSGAIFGTSGENVSWDCHSWNKDVKLLTIPTYVTFTAGV